LNVAAKKSLPKILFLVVEGVKGSCEEDEC
jgi:hypothetical protein